MLSLWNRLRGVAGKVEQELEQAAYVEIKILLQKTLASTIRRGVFTKRAVYGIQVLDATGPEEGGPEGCQDVPVLPSRGFICAASWSIWSNQPTLSSCIYLL